MFNNLFFLFLILFFIQSSNGSNWTKIFDFNINSEIVNIVETNDKGFVVVGRSTVAEDGGCPVFGGFILKVDSLGNSSWFNEINPDSSNYNYEYDFVVKDIIENESGDLFTITYKNGYISNYYITKYSYNGILEWEKSIGQIYSDESLTVDKILLRNNQNILCYRSSEGYYGGGVGNNSNGISEYSKQGEHLNTIVSYDTWDDQFEKIKSYCIDDNGIVVIGNFENELNRYFYQKIGTGNDWYNTINMHDEYKMSVSLYLDGYCLLFYKNNKLIIRFIDVDGNILWGRERFLESVTDISSINLAKDNGFIVSASVNGNPTIVRLNSSCNEIWRFSFEDQFGGRLVTAFETIRGDYLTIGNTKDSAFDPECKGFMINRTSSADIEESITDSKSYSISQNYPNPFNPTTTISYKLEKLSKVNLQVFNMKGEIVSELINEILKSGTHSVQFDGSNKPSGVYYYQLTIDEKPVETRKMIMIK